MLLLSFLFSYLSRNNFTHFFFFYSLFILYRATLIFERLRIFVVLRIWNFFFFFVERARNRFLLLTCRQRARPPNRPHRRSALLFEPLPRSFDPPETLHSTLTPEEKYGQIFIFVVSGIIACLEHVRQSFCVCLTRRCRFCVRCPIAMFRYIDNDLSLRVQKYRCCFLFFLFFETLSKHM